jgi:RimJ/RimL family protein N-acetyltransferase
MTLILITNNFIIRNATANDAEQLCTWWNNGAVMAHAGFPNGLGTAPEEIRKSLAKDTDQTQRRHMIELHGTPIGEMYYRGKGDGIAEIGIKICDPSQQERGFGTTLLMIFIDALFRYYGYEKIVLDTNVNNTRAQHVYEHKIGFRNLGVRQDAWTDQLGVLQSCIDYELTKAHWCAVHEEAIQYRHIRPEHYLGRGHGVGIQ